MLHSLYHNQYLLMQSLHHLSLQQLVMTLEVFLAQVAWPGVQPPSLRGVTPLVLLMMMPQMLKLMMIMLWTSVMLIELRIQGPHRIEAQFFTMIFFSLFFIFLVFSFLFFILISVV